jgi:pyrroloquinoline quinone biosynthesis protein B
MHILVLGSAAGGGVPQWNCNAPISRGVREGGLVSSAKNQASIALTADGERWVLVNASPDLRQQILLRRALWPREGRRRDSPIEAVLLTGAEIDNVAGLLTMRERQAFAIWSTARVLDMLAENPIFEVLDGALVARRPLRLDEPTAIAGPAGETGITATAFAVPGKVPLYLEKRTGGDLAGAAEGSIGLELSDGRRRLHYIPGCAKLTDEIRRRITGSALLFFDGTLWSDDEMIVAGVGEKTGRRMGHMSMAGPAGSVAQLAGIEIARKLFIHVNNTNPALLPDSAERAQLREAGWEVAADGMEIEL